MISMMENNIHFIDDDQTAATIVGQHNHQLTIRIPFNWERKLLSKYNKIYYLTPSGHILLTNSDVYTYLADPNTCKCSLDPALTFDDVFNFDTKLNNYNIVYDLKSKTIESLCEQWFDEQSYENNIPKLRSHLLDINQHLFCQYECDLNEIHQIYQRYNSKFQIDVKTFNDWYKSFDWSNVMMMKNGWLLTRKLNDINLKHFAFEMRNFIDSNIDDQQPKCMRNDIVINTTAISNDLMEISEKLNNDLIQLETELINDDLNYYSNIIKQLPLFNAKSDNNINKSCIIEYLNSIIQSSKSMKFISNNYTIIFEFDDPMIKYTIPSPILDLSINRQLDWSVIKLDWLKENYPIIVSIQSNNQNANNNRINLFEQINPFKMSNFDVNDNEDDGTNAANNRFQIKNENIDHNHMLTDSEQINNFTDDDNHEIVCFDDTSKSSVEQSSTKLSTIDIDGGSCSSIPIEVIEDLNNDDLLMMNAQTNDLNFEINLNDDDSCSYRMTMNLPKNLLELENNENIRLVEDERNVKLKQHGNEIISNVNNESTSKDVINDYNSLIIKHTANDSVVQTSSINNESSFDIIDGYNNYTIRHDLSSDENVHFFPSRERTFNVGDIVWGPLGDVCLWPGKLISTYVNDDDHEDNNVNTNKFIVRWFGLNDDDNKQQFATTILSSDCLRTLNEGLEIFNYERNKRNQTNEKSIENVSSLDKAIQEAMIELMNDNMIKKAE